VNLLLRKTIGTKPDPRWASLEGHASSLKKQKKWDDIVLQAKAAVEYSGSPVACMESVVELLCRVSNTIEVALIPTHGSLLMQIIDGRQRLSSNAPRLQGDRALL